MSLQGHLYRRSAIPESVAHLHYFPRGALIAGSHNTSFLYTSLAWMHIDCGAPAYESALKQLVSALLT